MRAGKWVRSALIVIVGAVFACAHVQSADIEDELRNQYGKRLTFKTEMARHIVYGFNINCEFPDGRYLPLVNLLLTRLRSMDTPELWGVTSIDSRGRTVRITDVVMDKKKGPVGSQLVMVINDWGELRLMGITADAVRNACSGYWGKIWRMPRQSR